MNPQRWQQIEELYHSARESGAAALAGVEPELRGQVEKLLAQDSESGDKLLDLRAADLLQSEHPAALASPQPALQLAPGSSLGPYKIESMLGQGGMGQVFRATDTRLGRSVAIKISREKFLSRFEKESRSIAAINHPNVCTLHDVGPNYLVMELLEGETLAARLKRGSLSVTQTIRFGSQIAAALAVAHSKGIVHRDLKPANIMITRSGIKVLDFGLARSVPDPSVIDPSLTASTAVMGTPAYMAPELFEGNEADTRSDIYALGLILSEMLTGKRSPHPQNLPPALARLVQRCLEADPDDRWQSARDLQWEIDSANPDSTSDSPSTSPRHPAHSPSRNLVLFGCLALALLALSASAILLLRRQPPTAPPARLNILLPEKSRVLSLAVSPDGTAIAVVLLKDGKQQIWIRALDAPDLVPLPGTDNAADPFWSPDSRFIAFIADARLKKIDRGGGPVQTLCDALGVLGGAWSRNGQILIAGLWKMRRLPEAGGPVTELPLHEHGTESFPVFFPDGRHYLSTVKDFAKPAQSGIWLTAIDAPDSRRILPDPSNAQLIEPPSGRSVGAVLFIRAGGLMALPFDFKHLQPTGDPVPVAPNIATGVNARWLASSSSNGTLAYVSGSTRDWQYVWRDRQGRNLGSPGHAGTVVTISPDGKHLVGNPDGDVTVLDLVRGLANRVVFKPNGGMDPTWSPDGQYLAYYNGQGILRKRSNGAGTEQLLLRTKSLALPKSWSPDGRYLIYAQINSATAADLLALPITDAPDPDHAHPLVLAQTPANEDQGQFSSDGRWVAYTSNESGQSEIYVIPFPPTPSGGRWQVSHGGGVQPRWRRDGKELFYISPDWKMVSVPVTNAPDFQSGTPQPLFDTHEVDTGIRTGPLSWDISADGSRFLIITDSSPDPSSLNVILNWRPEKR